MTLRPTHLIAAFGFGCAFIGSFLPWLRVLFVTKNGIEGDGVITAALAVVGVLSIFIARKSWRWLAVLAAAAIIAVVLYDSIDASQRLNELRNDDEFGLDLEFADIVAEGLVLTAVGGVIGLFAGAANASSEP